MTSLVQHVAVAEGPAIAVFQPLPAGSSLEWSLFFEEESAPGSGVYVPKSFTGLTLVSEVRLSIYDTNPIAGGIAATVSATPGFLDFLLPATVTAGKQDKVLHWGLKLVPADPARAQILVVGEIPITFAGVR